MILRIADGEKEPFDTIIDSADVCFHATMYRILKMIPVFNIIYPFWSEHKVQLDTVFKSLKNCDTLLQQLQEIENQGGRHISSCSVNYDEELAVLPACPMKEMLEFYKKYRDEAEIELKNSDLACIKEYFCEFVRRTYYLDKNSRFNAVFFYENLDVAAAANIASRQKTCKFAEVEIVETISLDRYDQRWLTDIKNTCICKECEDAIKNYWQGLMTDHPKVEYLFSGKYILKELK